MESPAEMSRSNTGRMDPSGQKSLIHNITYDPRPLVDFEAKAAADAAKISYDRGAVGDRLHMHIVEWDETLEYGAGQERFGFMSASSIHDTKHSEVRIIFAPRDQPHAEIATGLAELFVKFGVPTAFIAEGLDGASQSFGTYHNDEGTDYIWFHLLFKDVAKSHDHGAANASQEARKGDFSKQDFSWIKTGFVLKIEHGRAPTAQTRSDSKDSLATLTNNSATSVTLLAFGAPIYFRGRPTAFLERFQRLKEEAKCADLLQDPFVLLRLAFDEMHTIMDDVGWVVSDAFGDIEKYILEEASTPVKAAKKVDFTKLHNLMKHTIYLRENCDSALSTLDNLLAYHKKYTSGMPTTLQRSTRAGLKYRKTLFQSTQVRLSSLDKRMANVLQLSFHLVTQSDSKIQQSEALSMKTIAAVTLLFMPLTTVATVFGTQLIRLKDEWPHHMEVSRDFWVLWVISAIVTIFVVVFWVVWYRDEKAQLRDEVPKGAEGDESKHAYMGWKRLGQSVRRRIRGKKGREEEGEEMKGI